MLKTAALNNGRLERAIVEGAIDERATTDHNILHVSAQQSGCEGWKNLMRYTYLGIMDGAIVTVLLPSITALSTWNELIPAAYSVKSGLQT